MLVCLRHCLMIKKLEELREKAGLTQMELAKEVGMSKNTIINYEKGKTEPSEEKVERICMILKVNRGEIQIQLNKGKRPQYYKNEDRSNNNFT